MIVDFKSLWLGTCIKEGWCFLLDFDFHFILNILFSMARSKSKLGRKNDPAHRADKPGNKSNAYNQKLYHKFKKQLSKVLQNVHQTQVAIRNLQMNPNSKITAVRNDFGKLKLDRILRTSNIKGWKLKNLDLKAKLNDYNE